MTQISTLVTVAANPDLDDCLGDAAEEYAAEHPALAGYDLAPRWADDTRERVALTVPVVDTDARRAVERSISHTEIVTIDHDADALASLRAAADDSVVGNDTTEFWGATEDGSEWRVHVRHAATE